MINRDRQTSTFKTPIAARATEIADQVVPRYRCQKPYPSCTGTIAHEWSAAWEAAYIALGGDAAEYEASTAIDATAPPGAP